MQSTGLDFSRYRPIVVFATLACAAILLVMGVRSTDSFEHSGSASYAKIANNVAVSGFYSLDGENATALRPPAYPLFLAAAMILGGVDHWALLALLLQGAMAAVCLVLTALIAHRLFANQFLTAISTLLVAGNIPLMAEFFAMRETGIFILLTLLFVLLALAQIRPIAVAALLGAVSALAMLTRPSGVVLLPVAALVLVYLAGPSPMRAARSLAAYATVLCLCLAPWQVWLHQTFDRLSLSGTSTSGMNLFKGNHPLMGEIYNLADVDQVDPMIPEIVRQAGLHRSRDEWQADDHLAGLAIESILENPVRFVRRTGEKAIAFLSPANVPVGRGGSARIEDGTLVIQEPVVVVGSPRLLYHLFVIPLGILGVAGALLSPARRLWGLSAGALIIGTVLVYAVTFPEKRYRFPIEPLLAIAAVGVVHRYFVLGTCELERVGESRAGE